MYSAKLTRAELVARGGKGGVAIAGASLFGASAGPASAGVEEDLALVRLAIAGELVGAQFFAGGLDSGLFDGAVKRALSRAQFNDEEHLAALAQALAAAGQTPAEGYGDFVYTFPEGAFESGRRFGEVGVSLKTAVLGAYLGAVQVLESPGLRIAAARIASSEAAHLSVLAGLAGILPVGISFPALLDIEQASEGLAPFLS